MRAIQVVIEKYSPLFSITISAFRILRAKYKLHKPTIKAVLIVIDCDGWQRFIELCEQIVLRFWSVVLRVSKILATFNINTQRVDEVLRANCILFAEADFS